MRRIARIGIRVVLTVLILALLTGPLVAIFYISRLEQAYYTPQEVVQIRELAYGPVKRVTRQDMMETVYLSGTVVSTQYLYQELELPEPGKFRQEAKPGQLIQAGDILGYYKGEPVVAQLSGILDRISLGGDCYMRLESLEALAIECYVTDAQLKILSRSSLDLRDSSGAGYHILRIDEAATARGTRVLIGFEGCGYVYGDAVSEKQFQTGRKFPGALVVDESCVYQKIDGKFYVRLTDAEGAFLKELEVTQSYSNGILVCISGQGLAEGMYCDSGYKLVIESGGGHADT